MAEEKSEKELLADVEKFYEAKDFSQALFLAEKLVSDHPGTFPGKLLYVKILTELNRFKDAENYLSELNITYPDNLNVLLETAELHYRQKKFEESMKFFNRVLFLDSFNKQAKERIEEINHIREENMVERLEDTQAEVVVEEKPEEKEEKPDAQVEEAPADKVEEGEQLPGDIDIDILEEEPGKPESIVTEPEIDEGDKFPGEVDLEINVKEEETDQEDIAAEEAESPEPVEKPPEIKEKEEPREDEPGPETSDEAPEEVVEKKETAEVDFETESAAELYFNQGLYSEALRIFKKLYEQTSDDKYLKRIDHIESLHKKETAVKTIERLEKLLEIYQQWEKRHV